MSPESNAGLGAEPKWPRSSSLRHVRLGVSAQECWHMIEISPVTTAEQLGYVRALIHAFVDWHRERHVQDRHLIDEYFDASAFAAELASLPGEYSPPRGGLLLASDDGEPAGCVALRALDGQFCEMKRLFIYPRFRGRGIGRALADAVVQQARATGYKAMRLDTSVRQIEALSLYEECGFQRIEPYYELSAAMRSWLVFMELAL